MAASASSLEDLASRIKTCTLCGLCEGRTNAVPGAGNPHAEVVFIGEGPGATEDAQGVPFCGASGRFLDELLGSVNLNRADVYITNIVKCRPPGNRDPLPEEKATCAETYLVPQLDLIKPKLIVTLGRHAMQFFLPNLKISEAHGHVFRRNGQVYLPLFHPAVALYNGSTRGQLLEDFQLIPRLLEQLR